VRIYATHLDVVRYMPSRSLTCARVTGYNSKNGGAGDRERACRATRARPGGGAGAASSSRQALCTMRLSVSRLEPQPLGDDGWRLAARELAHLREVQREVDQRPQRVRGVGEQRVFVAGRLVPLDVDAHRRPD